MATAGISPSSGKAKYMEMDPSETLVFSKPLGQKEGLAVCTLTLKNVST